MRKEPGKRELTALRRYLRWRRSCYLDALRGGHPGLPVIGHALRALLPRKLPQQGWFNAQDADGGRQRFAELLSAVGPCGWDRAMLKWRREQLIFAMAAALSLTGLPLVWFCGDGGLSGVLSLLFLAGGFGVLAMRAGYRRWQLSARRLGSLHDFLCRARRNGGKKGDRSCPG
jgi:hypothetical protein